MRAVYAVGDRIDERYEVLEPLKAGAMGAVYRARDRQTGQEVAVKVLLERWCERTDLRARFQREALALQQLRHPHIVAYCGHGRDAAARPYLVTEFLPGTSGLELLERQPPPTPAEGVRVIAQLCLALAHAHSRGVIHRDLKWSNVMVASPGGAPLRAKLIDFGILKLADDRAGARLTATGVLLGTPEYVSPEQILGQPLDGRSDLYALAVMTWEVLAGERPYAAENPAVLLRMHLEAPIPSLRGRGPHPIPPTLEAVVLQGLAKAPDARPASVALFGQGLEAALAEAG